MSVVFNAIQSIISIVVMIVIGYILTSKGWFDENNSVLIPKLVTNISLPPLMVYTLISNFDKEALIKSSSGLIIPFLSVGVCYLLGKLASRIANVKYERRGLFTAMFFASNTIFIGLPVNLALFGEKSVPAVLLYYIGNTFFFWTLGIYDIRRFAEGRKDAVFSMSDLKNVFSPPLFGFIAGVILVFFDIKLPYFFIDTCKYLGNLTTPLSMIFVGITVHSVRIRDIRIDAENLIILLGRFIISPLIVVGLALLIPISPLMEKVFIIQAAMPVITQVAIISKAYNADDKYAATMVTLSTIISLIFIPVYILIFSYVK